MKSDDAYLRYIDDPAHKFTQSQGGVDRIASQLIVAKRYAAAQAFLEWNVARSPDSARALDGAVRRIRFRCRLSRKP